MGLIGLSLCACFQSSKAPSAFCVGTKKQVQKESLFLLFRVAVALGLHGHWEQIFWIQIQALPLTSCVTSGKSLNFSVLYFSSSEVKGYPWYLLQKVATRMKQVYTTIPSTGWGESTQQNSLLSVCVCVCVPTRLLGHNIRGIYFRRSPSKECENHWLSSYFTLVFFWHLQSKNCDWYRNSIQKSGVWSDRHQNMEVAEWQKVVAGRGPHEEAANRRQWCQAWVGYRGSTWLDYERPFLPADVYMRVLGPIAGTLWPCSLPHIKENQWVNTKATGRQLWEKREIGSWGTPDPQPLLNISHCVHSPCQRGQNLLLRKCHPQENSSRPGDRPGSRGHPKRAPERRI